MSLYHAARRRLLPLLALWAGAAALCSGQVTAEGFFDRAGAGLRGAEEEFGQYWLPHIRNSHRRILEAADAAQGRERALVLGAGNCTEIPLEALARRFAQVVIADLDRESMEQAVAELPPELRGKVEVRVTDVTSFAQDLMERTRTAIDASSTAQEAFDRFGDLVDAAPQWERPPSLPDADLVVSSLVLSELDRYPRTFADQLLRHKFGVRLRDSPRYEEVQLQLREAAIRDHIRLLRLFRRDGGAIYYADTVARGPLYANISAQQRQSVFQQITPALIALGFFRAVRHPEAQAIFSRGLAARRAQRGDRELTAVEIGELLESLAGTGDLPGGNLAAETITGMLCLGHFAAEAETELLERLLTAYEASSAEGFEHLVPLETVGDAWAKAGLVSQGPSEDWWWLEYPCSVSFREGAFRVKSWILK